MNHDTTDMEGLSRLVRLLRSENGCPWDRKQTPGTMAAYIVEEVYELADAIASGDPAHVCEELGDVLFHIFFIAQLYEEKGRFDLKAVVAGITRKMVRRHPHVFGSAEADTPEAVRRQWDIIKKGEKREADQQSILDGIPAGLPPSLKALQVSKKAAGAGFDWEDLAGVMEKVEEEWAEFTKEAVGAPEGSDKSRMAEEFGDLLFTLTNVARIAGFDADMALLSATRKFEKRFRQMEALAAEREMAIADVPRPELESLWNRVKEDPSCMEKS